MSIFTLKSHCNAAKNLRKLWEAIHRMTENPRAREVERDKLHVS